MNKDAEGRWKVGRPESNWKCGSSYVLSDFDTFHNPAKPITYSLSGHIPRVQPSLRQWSEDPTSTSAPGLVPKGANHQTDVYQLGLMMAEAICKRHFSGVPLEDIEGALHRSVRRPVVRFRGKRVNLLKFAKLIIEIVKEHVTTISDVRIQFETAVVESLWSVIVGRIITGVSIALFLGICFLYFQAVRIVGRAGYQYLFAVTTVYLVVSGVALAFVTQSHRHRVDLKELPGRLLLLLRGSLQSKILVFCYLLVSSIVLLLFTFADVKGDLYISI